jgi:hypothetical protein
MEVAVVVVTNIVLPLWVLGLVGGLVLDDVARACFIVVASEVDEEPSVVMDRRCGDALDVSLPCTVSIQQLNPHRVVAWRVLWIVAAGEDAMLAKAHKHLRGAVRLLLLRLWLGDEQVDPDGCESLQLANHDSARGIAPPRAIVVNSSSFTSHLGAG